MNSFMTVIKLAFEVLIALLMLGTSMFLFQHYRKGEDVASLPFAVSSLSLFASQIVLIVILSMTGATSMPTQYTLQYLQWYVSVGYLLFAVGIFWSIFFTGKILSTIIIPVIISASIFFGIGFLPSFMDWLPAFSNSGYWVLFLTGAIFLAVSLNYFLHWIREKQAFRIRMSVATLLLAITMLLHMFLPQNNFYWYANQFLRFLGFCIIFYEVQVGHS